jgi:8-amino-7-oxononanoate synthase
MSVNQIRDDLAKIKSKHLYRKLTVIDRVKKNKIFIDGRWLINFASNDYLGLSQNKKIQQAIIKGIREFGAGAGASHLVSGHFSSHDEVEKKLSKLLGFDKSLFFSSGYMANMSVIGGLIKRGDAVFCDKLNHASLNDAAILSRAKVYRFNHLDLSILERQIKKSPEKNKWIVSDGVFSMDGDIADIAGLLALCHKYNAYLFIDDAHGYGVLGENGQGILKQNNVKSWSKKDLSRVIYMVTLGKSVGISGAIVNAKKNIIDLLIQKSKPYIYTTASTPALANGVSVSLDIIFHGQILRKKLKRNIELFRHSIKNKGALLDSKTAIQPLIIGNPSKALRLAETLKEEGLYVPAIRPPTVPTNTSRLRVSLSSSHKRADILHLSNIINQAIN